MLTNGGASGLQMVPSDLQRRGNAMRREEAVPDLDRDHARDVHCGGNAARSALT